MNKNSRLPLCFKNINDQKRKGLIGFITAGDPDFETSKELALALTDGLCDVLELGMPFSDPMADGTSIQLASSRAIQNGHSMKDTLRLAQEIRKERPLTPLVLMGYANPIRAYGKTTFLKDINTIGVDALIVVDLPPEEDQELCVLTQNTPLHWIRLVTPSTSEERLSQTILPRASGFIYCVSTAGITGTQKPNPQIVQTQTQLIRKHSQLPIAVGFGIRSPHDAKTIANTSDAVVVGSAIVDNIAQHLPLHNCQQRRNLIASSVERMRSIKDVL
jgi:tryptophan synthase alpha chain